MFRDTRYMDHWNRFGPKFSGKRDEDGEEFLRRLHEYGSSRDLTEGELLRGLAEAFKGDALLWYRVEQTSWDTVESFVFYFREQFVSEGLQKRLRRDVELRTQATGETISEYLVKMRTLFSHLNPPLPLEQQLDICCTNVRPEMALHVHRDQISSFLELQQVCRRVEDAQSRAKSYRPPPPPEQLALPSTGHHPTEKTSRGRAAATEEGAATRDQYNPPSSDPFPAPTPRPRTPPAERTPSPRAAPRRQTAPAPVTPEPPQASRTPFPRTSTPNSPPPSAFRRPRTPTLPPPQYPAPQLPPAYSPSRQVTRIPRLMDFPCSPPTATPQMTASPVRCHNCRQQGHRYRDCPRPLGYFCRICGYPGVDVNTCRQCARVRAGNGPWGGQ